MKQKEYVKDPECYKYLPSSLWSVSFLHSPTASLNHFLRAPTSSIKGLLPGGVQVSSEQKSKMWCLPSFSRE